MQGAFPTATPTAPRLLAPGSQGPPVRVSGGHSQRDCQPGTTLGGGFIHGHLLLEKSGRLRVMGILNICSLK